MVQKEGCQRDKGGRGILRGAGCTDGAGIQVSLRHVQK